MMTSVYDEDVKV